MKGSLLCLADWLLALEADRHKVKKTLCPASFLLVLLCTAMVAAGQSGSGGARPAGREYAVNLTFAAFQYDGVRSPEMQQLTRLTSTASSAQEEMAHVRDKFKLEELAVRHVRSVGLRSGEAYEDAVLLGPEYMVFSVTPRDAVRGFTKLDVRVRYGDGLLLDMKNVELENYETVLLRGGKGPFGVRSYVGAGGGHETVSIERTLLLSVTPEIVPLSNLRNRPRELSQPLAEHGTPLTISDRDRFTAPVPLERVAPKFDSMRQIRGSVLLGGVVGPDGKIANVKVLRSLDPVIDERAIDAFRRYRFSPALLNGKPVHATYREELTFAPPPPSILEMEEQLRKERELELEKERQRRRRP